MDRQGGNTRSKMIKEYLLDTSMLQFMTIPVGRCSRLFLEIGSSGLEVEQEKENRARGPLHWDCLGKPKKKGCAASYYVVEIMRLCRPGRPWQARYSCSCSSKESKPYRFSNSQGVSISACDSRGSVRS